LEIGETSAEGVSVERHRLEDRGTEGAEEVRCGEGVPPTRDGSGEGAVPPPQKIFRFLS